MRSDLIVTIEKWMIWGGLIGLIFLLRHLFPVFFFTFILSWIGNTVLCRCTARVPFRRTVLITLYLLFVLGLAGVGALVIPRVYGEARGLVRQFIAQEEERDVLEAEFARSIQEETGARPVAREPESSGADSIIERETRKLIDSALTQALGPDTLRVLRGTASYEGLLSQVDRSLAGVVPMVILGVRTFVNNFVAVAFQFLLSLVFSFIVLWDLPKLKAGARTFRTGRTADVYREIAPGMAAFGVMLGQAFEAQSIIAIVNTILTTTGFLILGIPSVALLGTIVFFCSYIPVVGVFLSTLPAMLLAFKLGGITKVVWLSLIVLIVHAIEAYALNPVIYGRRLKLHPVAVLVILLGAEHLFGVWGLVLGVPVAAFVLKYVIRGEQPEAREAPQEDLDSSAEVAAG